jgi:(5-formylfuran-3-yl)methyl phosphate synthase
MTLFLASVRSIAEAEIALGARADIIDLKEPTRGALGAVARETVAETVRLVGGRALTSATVGDLPMRPEILAEAIGRTADCGVDFVKFGIIADQASEACLQALAPLAAKVRLIGVLFADALHQGAISVLAQIGAAGVMLDTREKARGSLLDHLDLLRLRRLVAEIRDAGMLAGLAGSLRADHVPPLLRLEPNLLGFRGALCADGARIGPISQAACLRIRAMIPGTGGIATAPAPLPEDAARPIC